MQFHARPLLTGRLVNTSKPIMKLANNKLANPFTALVVCSSFVVPASATVNKDHSREYANGKRVTLFFDELGTGGWGVPSPPAARNTATNSPHRVRHQ